MSLHNDQNWLRAGNWFSTIGTDADLAILGVGASKSALTPNKAYETPAAIREALFKYSTYKASLNIELSSSKALDLGDVSNADDQTITTKEIAIHLPKSKVLILLGGDNSITFSGVSALADGNFEDIGLITLDAHHDVRDGISNGSPIRQLIEAGLPGQNIVQIGISDFANSKIYADRVSDYGIEVIHRRKFDQMKIIEIAAEALAKLSHCTAIYLDIDIDVCDRSVVPAAPAAVPGGLTADQLRELVFELSKSKKLNLFDITEIDASIDSADQRTSRLAALCILEIASAKSL